MTDLVQLTAILRGWTDIFTTRSMHAWSRYVKASGLSMPQFGILMELYYHRSRSVSDISEKMDISAAAASQLVDKLVQSGLLLRTEDPSDRRGKLLELSDNGRGLIERGVEARSTWVEDLVTSITPEEYDSVAAALESLTRAASRFEFKKPDKHI